MANNKIYSFDAPGDGNLFIRFKNGGELFLDDEEFMYMVSDMLLDLHKVIKKDLKGGLFSNGEFSITDEYGDFTINYFAEYDLKNKEIVRLKFMVATVSFEIEFKDLKELEQLRKDLDKEIKNLKKL